ASIDALPRLFPQDHIAGGLLLANEIEFLQKITNVTDRPFVALLGGAKIAGKIEPLEALVKTADTVLIGGGMANTFLAARGINMGGSLVDNESIEVAKRISKVMLPVDVVLEDGSVVDVAKGITGKALDIGPKTIAAYESKIKTAKTIFWNGPMGMFEKKEFAKGTMAMARALAEADATTVVGGGESVEAVNESGYADRISHISTGGGASLEFIAGAALPGIEVLRVGSDLKS
ncbi:MAG TPA: phosphoglycerate kinase, partial [Thermoanaerobaculia bacterium]|nr:phosphoglycerate kinase [Thermoanaerobaculia bacterium]